MGRLGPISVRPRRAQYKSRSGALGGHEPSQIACGGLIPATKIVIRASSTHFTGASAVKIRCAHDLSSIICFRGPPRGFWGVLIGLRSAPVSHVSTRPNAPGRATRACTVIYEASSAHPVFTALASAKCVEEVRMTTLACVNAPESPREGHESM